MKDHVGNVRVVYGDYRIDEYSDANKKNDKIVYSGFTDYYPYGLAMDNRKYQGESYLFGFQGMEQEPDQDETQYHTLFRQYDAVLGRWWSSDPEADHPRQIGKSPYLAFWGNPVNYKDISGDCPECPPSEYVPLAKHVYSAKRGDVTSNNWEVVDVIESSSGHRAALYQGMYNGKREYIFASAGTQDMQDLIEDYKSLSGDSEQFGESIKIAQKLSDDQKFKGISFTGHSLGGGLASANALSTGGKAVTFNAMGIPFETKKDLGLLGKKANITAFVVEGEILDFFQSMTFMRAEGDINILPATYISLSVPLIGQAVTITQQISNHSIEVVEDKMQNLQNKAKSDDEEGE